MGFSQNDIAFALNDVTFKVVDVDFEYDAYGPKYSNISPPFCYFCGYSPQKPKASAIIYELDTQSLRQIASHSIGGITGILDAFRQYIRPYKDSFRYSLANQQFSWNGIPVSGAASYNFVRLPLTM